MLIPTLVASLLLVLERVTYVVVWRYPDRFADACSRYGFLRPDPVDALQALFIVFKVIQIGVFIAWWSWFGGDFPPLPTASPTILALGAVLLVIGQVLNVGVFWRLGKSGVFYGNRLGRTVPWVSGFPFSMVPHPQYLGTLLSVWGVFLIMRHPHPDWVILPLVSTLYYLLAMRLETSRTVTNS